MALALEFFTATNHKLSDNSSRVTVTGSSYYQNVFGNLLINSLNNECHCWQFKILRNRESYGIDIGIINSSNLPNEPSFTSEGNGYGLCSNGNIYSANCINKNNYKLKKSKQKYKANDLILMTLNLKTKTLSFLIDNKNSKINNKKIIIKNIKCSENIQYKMAVYLSYKKDSIQLLNHIKTIPKIIPKIKPKSIIKNNENNNYKQIIFKLKNIIKQKDNKLIETETKLRELELKLNALQNERQKEKDLLNKIDENIIQKQKQLEKQNQTEIQIFEQKQKQEQKQIEKQKEIQKQTELNNIKILKEKQIEIEKQNKILKEKKINNKMDEICEMNDKNNKFDKKHAVIKSDDSWRLDLKNGKGNNNKKRRRSVMELMENKAVSRRLSRSSSLIQTTKQ